MCISPRQLRHIQRICHHAKNNNDYVSTLNHGKHAENSKNYVIIIHIFAVWPGPLFNSNYLESLLGAFGLSWMQTFFMPTKKTLNWPRGCACQKVRIISGKSASVYIARIKDLIQYSISVLAIVCQIGIMDQMLYNRLLRYRRGWLYCTVFTMQGPFFKPKAIFYLQV